MDIFTIVLCLPWTSNCAITLISSPCVLTATHLYVPSSCNWTPFIIRTLVVYDVNPSEYIVVSISMVSPGIINSPSSEISPLPSSTVSEWCVRNTERNRQTEGVKERDREILTEKERGKDSDR